MEVLGLIFGLAAAIFALVGWGLAGAAFSRTQSLKDSVEQLERRIAQLETTRND